MAFGHSGASDASPKTPLQRSVQPAVTNLALRTDNDFKNGQSDKLCDLHPVFII